MALKVRYSRRVCYQAGDLLICVWTVLFGLRLLVKPVVSMGMESNVYYAQYIPTTALLFRISRNDMPQPQPCGTLVVGQRSLSSMWCLHVFNQSHYSVRIRSITDPQIQHYRSSNLAATTQYLTVRQSGNTDSWVGLVGCRGGGLMTRSTRPLACPDGSNKDSKFHANSRIQPPHLLVG